MSESENDPLQEGEPSPAPVEPSRAPSEVFDAPMVVGEVSSDEVIVAELVEPPPPLWPAFVVVIGAIMGAAICSGIALAAAAVFTGNTDVLRSSGRLTNWLSGFASSPGGLMTIVLPGQIAFAASAFGASVLLSGNRWTERLGMQRGRLPIATWILFLIGTPVVGLLAGVLLSGLSDKPSEQLKMMERMFQFDSIGSLMLLLALISLLPGVVEELLFRGFMQRRLLTRLPASTSILICSAFFAAAHMDPMHALGVFPLGLWLGTVAWRADSIWPAVFGHIGNNGFAIVMSRVMGGDSQLGDANPLALLLIGTCLAAFTASIVVLVAGPRSPATRTAHDA